MEKKKNTGNWNSGRNNTGDSNSGNENSGSRNSGNKNVGSYNSGSKNNGDKNIGSNNNGHKNSGDYNIGSNNSGSCNVGDYNSGNYNAGNHNSGHYNSGDWNSTCNENGCFNTKRSTINMFNKPSNWTYFDWEFSEARKILDKMPTNEVEWVWNLSENEKKRHPEAEVTQGILKKTRKSQRRQHWWNNLSDEDKKTIMDLPNFDREIFREITGIVVK